MALSTGLKMRYSAPLHKFNPRSNWELYINRMKRPIEYLDDIGIYPICEMILMGCGPRDVAIELGISQTILLKWIEDDSDRKKQYEWAINAEGDNKMYEAMKILDDAPLDPVAIGKAAKQAEHRRHMAKGMGAKRWGNKVDVNQNVQATLSYSFDIAVRTSDVSSARVISGEAKKIEETKPFDFNDLLGAGSAADLLVNEKDGLTYEEAKAQEEDFEGF